MSALTELVFFAIRRQNVSCWCPCRPGRILRPMRDASTQDFLIGQIERDVINRNKFRREIPSIEVPGFMNIEASSQHVARWK
jgi:hypothetical protein